MNNLNDEGVFTMNEEILPEILHALHSFPNLQKGEADGIESDIRTMNPLPAPDGSGKP